MGLILILIGLMGMPFVYIVFPIRLLWSLYTALKPSGDYVIDRELYISSFAFAGATIALVVYFYYQMVSAGPGTSGFLVAYVTAFPFGTYILFEVLRYKAFSKNTKENKALDSERETVDSSKFVDADEYAHKNDLNVVEVINELREGTLNGRHINNQWFVSKKQ